VVGAGPAGSVAALVLARGGARVALVDKAAFPRDKACGDLIGPRGVQVLTDLAVAVPDAGRGTDLLAVGPSGRRSRLPAYPGRSYPGHGIVVPRLELDHALREAALAAGATGVKARITAAERGADGTVTAVLASDGRRLAGEVIIGADGALSPVARAAGMLDSGAALWGFAVRAYVPAQVPLPLLVLLDSRPWRIYPGYGWLFPGSQGQANVGIGVGMGGIRRRVALRSDLARLCAVLAERGDLAPGAATGPVIGGWLRMGGTGTPPARGNVLLVGDAAGLINPLQGEGIGPAMVSARLAGDAVLASLGAASMRAASPRATGLGCAGRAAGRAYAESLAAGFGDYMPGAAALQRVLLRRPRVTSAGMRLLTVPAVRGAVAGTWSIYWNGLVDGARPRPSAWAARAVQCLAGRLAGYPAAHLDQCPDERLDEHPDGHLDEHPDGHPDEHAYYRAL
jgi:geranylgeranyl reductase family protein